MTALPSTRDAADTMAPGALSDLFQAVGGLRNFRAAAAMLACFLTALLLIALVGAMGGLGVVGSMLTGLLVLIIGFTGIHASGVLLMDQARGVPARSIVDAIVYGLLCVPKTLALILALVLVAIAVNVVMALLFFISKTPGVGPLLFAVAFPLAVLVSGLTFAGLWMGMMLALSAIWEGSTIAGAFFKSLSVLRHRLVETVLLLLVVAILSGFVAMVVFSILFAGFWPATGLAARMLGVSIDSLQGFASVFGGAGLGMGHGGYVIAGLFGAGVLWALALTLVLQVWHLGVNLVYLKVSEGLDASVTEDALQARLADARRKATEIGQKAREATDRARAQAEHALEQRRAAGAASKAAAATAALAPVAPAVPPARAPVASTCPACSAVVAAQDVFCGACGHRLGG
ncbi:MAG: zinc ribbon domain-containing protein [Rubrivivax sp.]